MLATPNREKADEVYRVIFNGVGWDVYEAMLDKVGDQNYFITYDGEDLEIMSPLPEHEYAALALYKIIQTLTRVLDIPIRGLGSTTFRKKSERRGLEPDQCFYIRNASRIRGKKRIDLRKDPPPDLVIEVEITSRLLDRVEVYSKLGVPELWRYDGLRLRAYLLRDSGEYEEVDRSPTFPMVQLKQIESLVRRSWKADEHVWNASLEKWAQSLTKQ